MTSESVQIRTLTTWKLIQTNVSDLLDLFFTLGTLPTVKYPTRITHSSATLIGNVYVKCEKYENIRSRIIQTDISDHFPILIGMGSRQVAKRKEPLIFTQRKIGPHQIQKITDALITTQWNNVFLYRDIDRSYNQFLAHFTNILNLYAPLTKTKIPYKSIMRESWMTKGLIKSSRKKEQLYKKTIGMAKTS